MNYFVVHVNDSRHGRVAHIVKNKTLAFRLAQCVEPGTPHLKVFKRITGTNKLRLDCIGMPLSEKGFAKLQEIKPPRIRYCLLERNVGTWWLYQPLCSHPQYLLEKRSLMRACGEEGNIYTDPKGVLDAHEPGAQVSEATTAKLKIWDIQEATP